MIRISDTDFEFSYFSLRKIVFKSLENLCLKTSDDLFCSDNSSISSFYNSYLNTTEKCIYLNIFCDDFNIENPLLSKNTV